MIIFALLLGIFTHGVFLLGIAKFLNPELLFWYTFVFWGTACIVFFRYMKMTHSSLKFDRFSLLILLFLGLSLLVNLVGALGPELAFDSLWYHLTLPNLYLEYGKIPFFSGGLLYYSSMPKFTELLYTVAFSFSQSEVPSKLIHYGFGLLSLASLYVVSRQFLSQKLSFVVLAVLASNLVFAWEMGTSYTDLTWMFFEVLSFFSFILYFFRKKRIYLVFVGVFIGFSIMTKPVAVVSLILYLSLLVSIHRRKLEEIVKSVAFTAIPAFVIPLPWLVFSYIHTHNPFYPFFSGYMNKYETSFSLITVLNPINFIQKVGNLFLFSPDPISPLYLVFAPLLFIVYKKLAFSEKLILFYCFLSLFLWYLIPPSGGSRFILPYLPVFSLAVGIILTKLNESSKHRKLLHFSIGLILLTLFATVLYRGVANAKYFPVIIGAQSKSDFLTSHLNFDYGDFYDTDGYFKSNISKNQRVLLIGFHNLYYVDFPYVHYSYHDGEFFTHVATQKADLPEEFKSWPLVYENSKTYVKLYARPLFQE